MESYDDKDKDDDVTGAKDNNCAGDGNGDGDGDGGGDMNTGARGGSAEWLRLLRTSALTEALGAMAKSKTSL